MGILITTAFPLHCHCTRAFLFTTMARDLDHHSFPPSLPLHQGFSVHCHGKHQGLFPQGTTAFSLDTPRLLSFNAMARTKVFSLNRPRLAPFSPEHPGLRRPRYDIRRRRPKASEIRHPKTTA